MALKNIKNFLRNFRFSNPPEQVLEQKAIEVLKESFSFSQEDCQVKIKQPIIFITATNSVLKNELYLNQAQILKRLKDKFPTCSFQRIRFI